MMRRGAAPHQDGAVGMIARVTTLGKAKKTANAMLTTRLRACLQSTKSAPEASQLARYVVREIAER